MKLSELWLREWVKVELDSRALSEQITMAGLEVDSIKSVAGIFSGVFVGEIIECHQHPNADKWHITKVNIGKKHPISIVCSAPNCRQGLKVAVATIDAVLSNGFKIKKSNLRGKLSEGRLCSFYDLGISDCKTIIELPVDASIGTDIHEYMKLDDNIIEISVTSNRADCLSMIGIARDVAALNQTKLNIPKVIPISTIIKEKPIIRVDIPEVCPRYLSRIIKNINIKVSTPLWMREKLRRCGMYSTNSVISDITNYVLLELGQPIHVFDKTCIEGDMVVRMAKKNESVVLSDSSKIKLNTDTAIIADNRKVLAICGICVGEDSSVSDKTQDILLECAFFNPSVVTDCVRCYGLHTEASYRYERGVDPFLQYRAIERVTDLLINICGGKTGPIIDVTNEANLPKRTSILLHRRKLDRLVGHYISNKRVNCILHNLGFEVSESQDTWHIIVPSWRFDIKIEEDLVEEIVRIYGYNNIPDKPIQPCLEMRDYRESILSLKRVKTMLNDKGYQEVITYSFVDPKLQQLVHPGEEALVLPNPISSEMSVMRLSLWTGLLKTVIYNQNRQQNRVRIFETGLRFVPDLQSDLGMRQDLMLSGIISGNCYEEHWNLTKNSVDFYDMKGDLESVFDLTGRLSEFEFSSKEIAALHPGQSAAIYLCNECVGFIGAIHPELEYKLNLNGPTVMFEIEWNKISSRVIPQVQEISRFPSIRRDISVVVNENIPAAAILSECKRIDVKNHVVSINLFDVYRGKGIAKNYKSLAISLIFQDPNRTPEEEEVSDTVSRYIKVLKDRFRASLRK